MTNQDPSSSHSEPEQAVPRMLAASRLAQYVSRKRCERYLHLYLFPSVTKRLQDRWGVRVEPLSPLLSGEGQSFEREKVEELGASGEQVVNLTNKDVHEFFEELRRQPEGRVYYYQPSLQGRIGDWLAGGRADLISTGLVPRKLAALDWMSEQVHP